MRILVALPYAPSLIRVRPYNLLRELAKRHDLTILIAGPRPSDEDLQTTRTFTDDIHVVGPAVTAVL
jgi:hypothetical protein